MLRDEVSNADSRCSGRNFRTNQDDVVTLEQSSVCRLRSVGGASKL